MSTRRPRRLGLWLPWLVFALLAGGWAAYWHVLSAAALGRLAAWSQAQIAAGGPPGYVAAAASGFPLRLHLTLQGAAFASPDGALQARVPRAVVSVNPVNPSHILLDTPDPLAYRLHQGDWREITGETLRASLNARGDQLVRASVEGSALRIGRQGVEGPALEIRALSAHLRPDPRDDARRQLAFQAQGVALPSPVRAFEGLGQTLEALEAAVVLTQPDALFGANQPDALEAWRRAGGQAQIEGLRLVWGDAAATGTGAVQLDAARRLAGRLDLRLEDPAGLLGALARSPSANAEARAALGALGPLIAAALRETDAAFIAEEGALRLEARTPFGRLGPARLRSLDPVY